jgi:serine/threonine-protein kinase
MGAVYHVLDDKTASPRALKIMLPSVVQDPGMRARFALEATVTGAIVSDHIVRVSDAGIDELTGTPFLVMDLLQGDELGSMIKKRGALPAIEVITYLRQVALALDKTHAAGIVHRDLKPDNLFATYRDDGSPCVKILDFGVAKIVAQSTAHATSAIGTPIYMAPEQMRGEGTIGPTADLYALGHIAYTLLAGEPYWQEELRVAESIFVLLTRVLSGVSERPSARAARRAGIVLPPSFDMWFQRATAMRAEHRFDRASTSIAELARALDVIATPRLAEPSYGSLPAATRAPMPSAVERNMQPAGGGRTTGPLMSAPGKTSSGHHGLLLLIATLSAVTIAGVGVFLARTRAEQSNPAASITASAVALPATTTSDAVASSPAADAGVPSVAASMAAPAPTPTASTSSAPPKAQTPAPHPFVKPRPTPDGPAATHHGVY